MFIIIGEMMGLCSRCL